MSTPDAEGPDLSALDSIDRLIHEPARLQIVSWLSALEEADFLFLLQQTGQTRGNLSSHISKLETAGYVAVNKAFIGKVPRTVYKLTDPGKEAFEAYRRDLLAILGAL